MQTLMLIVNLTSLLSYQYPYFIARVNALYFYVTIVIYTPCCCISTQCITLHDNLGQESFPTYSNSVSVFLGCYNILLILMFTLVYSIFIPSRMVSSKGSFSLFSGKLYFIRIILRILLSFGVTLVGGGRIAMMAISMLVLGLILTMHIILVAYANIVIYYIEVSCSIVLIWLLAFGLFDYGFDAKYGILIMIIAIGFSLLVYAQAKEKYNEAKILTFFRGIVDSPNQIEIILFNIMHSLKNKKNFKDREILIKHCGLCNIQGCECESVLESIADCGNKEYKIRNCKSRGFVAIDDTKTHLKSKAIRLCSVIIRILINSIDKPLIAL